jgi:hypothetical protein
LRSSWTVIPAPASTPTTTAAGSGVWSGTSFSAPALAGALAARLHREDDEASDVSPRAMAARARKALGDELGWSG